VKHERLLDGRSYPNPKGRSNVMESVPDVPDVVGFLSYIGFMFLAYCAVVGFYITVRWGTVGVTALWRFRRVLDETVKEDFREIVT
jgi:hypothetical protein